MAFRSKLSSARTREHTSICRAIHPSSYERVVRRINLSDSRRFNGYSDQQYDDSSTPLRPINLPRGQIVHMTQRSMPTSTMPDIPGFGGYPEGIPHETKAVRCRPMKRPGFRSNHVKSSRLSLRPNDRKWKLMLSASSPISRFNPGIRQPLLKCRGNRHSLQKNIPIQTRPLKPWQMTRIVDDDYKGLDPVVMSNSIIWCDPDPHALKGTEVNSKVFFPGWPETT